MVAVLFFLSGFGGLVYQILWMRELGLLFGTTAHAAATTAASFFLGLGAGSAFFGERSRRTSRPLMTYGFLEIAVSVSALLYFGLFSLYQAVYPKVFHSLEEQAGVLLLVKFLLAMVVLFPPAFFMGGTLPVISRFLTERFQGNGLGHTVPLFYGINTLGAAAGTLAAGFYLPRVIGVQNSYVLAIGITTLVGVIAILLGRGQGAEKGERKEHAPLVISRPILWLAFFSGFTTLALEVLWTRMFAQTLQNSVYSYAIILFTFLIALALGAWISGWLARVCKQSASRVLVWALLIAGLLTFLSPTLFHEFGSDKGGLLGSTENWGEYLRLVFTSAGITIFPATIALGVVFPSLLNLANPENAEDSGRIVGRLAGINTFGAVLGSLAGGFFFLDALGLWQSVRLIAVAYLLMVFAFSGWSLSGAGSLRERFPVEAVLSGLILLIGLSWIDPARLPVVYYSKKKKETVVEVREKSDATVAIIRKEDTLRLKVNNFYALGNSGAVKSERFQAQLPLIIHPNPKRVFCLGLGTGITASGALQIDEVEHLTVTELLPSVVEASEDFFSPWLNGLHEDERVKVIAEDGRNYLAATEEQYDVIVADLFLPWRSGVGSLYTVDHYERSAERLLPGGMYAQWLPMYQLSELEFSSIVTSMRQVFPQISVWRGDFNAEKSTVCLVGQLDKTPIVWEPFERRSMALNKKLENNQVAPFKNLAGHLTSYAGNLSATDFFTDGVLNTDDKPYIEYISPMRHRAEKAGEVSWIYGKDLLKIYDQLQLAAPFTTDPWLESAPREARNIVYAGHVLHEFNYAARNKLEKEEKAAAAKLQAITKAMSDAYGAY